MIEKYILFYLLDDTQFFNKTILNLTPDLFVEEKNSAVLKMIKSYLKLHSTKPSFDDLVIFLSNYKISEKRKKEIKNYIDEIKLTKPKITQSTLLKEVEKWVKTRSLENAIIKSADILQNDKIENKEQIEDVIKKALTISFFNDLGMDYMKDVKKRLLAYRELTEFFPCNLQSLDLAVGGGFAKKALYIFAGKTNIGKTLWLTNIASLLLQQGYNVVYFTAEMAENRIAQRIDSNLLNIEMNDLPKISEDRFLKEFAKLKERVTGNLIIKEYPTSTASALTIENFLNELSIKKGFKPDFVIVDYLTIFNSYRLPASSYNDTYNYYRSVAEELRGLAVKQEIGVITAAQINRTTAQIKNFEKIDDTGTSDSYGITFTADFQSVIIQTPELKKQNKFLLKVLKTRFSDNNNEIYTIGVDYKKMKLYELEEDKKNVPLITQEQMKNDDVEDFKF